MTAFVRDVGHGLLRAVGGGEGPRLGATTAVGIKSLDSTESLMPARSHIRDTHSLRLKFV